MIKTIIDKIDTYCTAIEAIEVLVQNHNEEVLKPILVHLKSAKMNLVQNLSIAKMKIEVEHEEVQITRLSNI